MVPAQPLVLSGKLSCAQSGEREGAVVLNTRRVRERVYHAVHAGDAAGALEDLASVPYIAAKFVLTDEDALLHEYRLAGERLGGAAAELREFSGMVLRNWRALQRRIPLLAFQIALQEPERSGPFQSLCRSRVVADDPQMALPATPGATRSRLVDWPQRPQEPDACPLVVRAHERPVRTLALFRCGPARVLPSAV
jgi:hypothetical protein